MEVTERAEGAGPVILIVEDDATIADLLAYNLRRAGFTVRQERNGRDGLQTALAADLDIVLMDLMLPGLDGLTATSEIKRRKPRLPVIMLTARDERDTVLRGFETGADDYVTKPFDMDVLVARIQARLRKPGQLAQPVTSTRGGGVSLGSVSLDPDARTLRVGDRALGLKPKEFDLLQLLLSEPGRLFSREEIVERVWRQRYLPGSRSLDVQVRRLREKLEEAEADVGIETFRGVGYRIVVLDRPDTENR